MLYLCINHIDYTSRMNQDPSPDLGEEFSNLLPFSQDWEKGLGVEGIFCIHARGLLKNQLLIAICH